MRSRAAGRGMGVCASVCVRSSGTPLDGRPALTEARAEWGSREAGRLALPCRARRACRAHASARPTQPRRARCTHATPTNNIAFLPRAYRPRTETILTTQCTLRGPRSSVRLRGSARASELAGVGWGRVLQDSVRTPGWAGVRR